MSPGFGFSMGYTVNFEQATADYDLVRAPDNLLRLFRPGQPAETVKCAGADGYVGELQHMIDAILTGRPPSVVTMQDGLASVEICEAELHSIESRQPIAL